MVRDKAKESGVSVSSWHDLKSLASHKPEKDGKKAVVDMEKPKKVRSFLHKPIPCYDTRVLWSLEIEMGTRAQAE